MMHRTRFRIQNDKGLWRQVWVRDYRLSANLYWLKKYGFKVRVG
jgi:hypothetical protein